MTTTTETRDSKGRFKAERSSLGALAGAGAAGVAIGMLAMIGRKAAVQAPTYLAGEWDEALAAEHKAVLKIFDAIGATEARQTTKRTILLTQLKHALAKHALEEENVIYPALAETGEQAAADELNTEHGHVKAFLYKLDNTPKDSARFLEIVSEFRREIADHMREEEERLFPALRAKLTPERNQQLTQAMNREGFKIA